MKRWVIFHEMRGNTHFNYMGMYCGVILDFNLLMREYKIDFCWVLYQTNRAGFAGQGVAIQHLQC